MLFSSEVETAKPNQWRPEADSFVSNWEENVQKPVSYGVILSCSHALGSLVETAGLSNV